MSYSDDTILALSGHELPTHWYPKPAPVRLLTDYSQFEPSDKVKDIETERMGKLGWEVTEIRVVNQTFGACVRTDYYGYKNRRQS